MRGADIPVCGFTELSYLFSEVELVALRRVAPRPAAQRLPGNRAVRASRSAAARGGVVAARQPLPLNRYELSGSVCMCGERDWGLESPQNPQAGKPALQGCSMRFMGGGVHHNLGRGFAFKRP